MRIGLLVPSIYTARKYGEGRIFAPLPLAIDLADRLVDRGHEVVMYTSGDVATKARVVAGNAAMLEPDPQYYQFRYREPDEAKYTALEIVKRDYEYDLTLRAYQDAQAGKLDVIHSFHDFGAHYFDELTQIPTIYTLHDPLPQRTDTIEYFRYSKFAHHQFVSISDSQRYSVVSLNCIATVYHGIDTSLYDVSLVPDNELVHFGRIMADKGTDVAIDVAKEAGIPITIATSTIRANRSQGFFEEKIAPQIDGKAVKAVGFLEGKEKSAYIGKGKAFLFPLAWDEPFGLVMIEAMACGTPVIAYNRGSVSEIVRDGVTGFIIDPPEVDLQQPAHRAARGTWTIKQSGKAGLIEAIRRIGEIDRAACRSHVETRFSLEAMADGYEKIYTSLQNNLRT
ncbi:glycosyltransferase family 4 protein [Candidatus Gottesmanbacteria bacterium]|nr:glycosyltransferase family 4 protein [Candidatus Gottesmanbacteria bacterium]